MFIMNDATSVVEILSCYPALKHLTVVGALILWYALFRNLPFHVTTCIARTRIWIDIRER